MQARDPRETEEGAGPLPAGSTLRTRLCTQLCPPRPLSTQLSTLSTQLSSLSTQPPPHPPLPLPSAQLSTTDNPPVHLAVHSVHSPVRSCLPLVNSVYSPVYLVHPPVPPCFGV